MNKRAYSLRFSQRDKTLRFQRDKAQNLGSQKAKFLSFCHAERSRRSAALMMDEFYLSFIARKFYRLNYNNEITQMNQNRKNLIRRNWAC